MSWCRISSLNLMRSLMERQSNSFRNKKFRSNYWNINNSLEIDHHLVYCLLESLMPSSVENCLPFMNIEHQLKDFYGKSIAMINGELNSGKCWLKKWEKCLKITLLQIRLTQQPIHWLDFTFRINDLSLWLLIFVLNSRPLFNKIILIWNVKYKH